VTTVLYYGDAIASYKQVTYSDASIIIPLFKHVLNVNVKDVFEEKDND